LNIPTRSWPWIHRATNPIRPLPSRWPHKLWTQNRPPLPAGCWLPSVLPVTLV
jgi:hypothetical protein